MIKGLKISLATILAFCVCYYWGKFAGYTGFSFAWVLNFSLMAWYTYIDSLFEWKFESGYFKPQAFEKGGTIYRFLGVHYFRRLLVLVGWESISRKNNRISKDESALKWAEHRTRSSEVGHTVIFAIVLMVTLLVCGSFRQASWLLILNLLLNVYPVLVQRYNRPRYQRVLQGMKIQK